MELSTKSFYEVAINLSSFFSLVFLLNHSVLLFIFCSSLHGVRMVCYHSEILYGTIITLQRKLLARIQQEQVLLFRMFRNTERALCYALF